MITLSIILFILFTIAIIVSLILLVESEGPFLTTLTAIVAISCLILAFRAYDDVKKQELPTKQDVLDGKAYYQETQIITNNDTIKTYEIVWKQEYQEHF